MEDYCWYCILYLLIFSFVLKPLPAFALGLALPCLAQDVPLTLKLDTTLNGKALPARFKEAAPTPGLQLQRTLLTTDVGPADELHAEALAALKTGRPLAAVSRLWLLARKYPQTHRYRYDYVAVLEQADFYREALEEGWRLDWNIAPAYVLEALARSARSLGKASLASSLFERVATRYPERSSAWSALVFSLVEEGAHLSARLKAEEGLRRHPGDSSLWEALAYVERTQSRYAEALYAYRKALEAHPGNREAQRGLAQMLKNLGAPHGALRSLAGRGSVLGGNELLGHRLDAAAHRLRWEATARPDQGERYGSTDEALSDLAELEDRFCSDPVLLRLVRYDKVLALVARRQYAQAVSLHESLVAEGEVPDYVRLGAAEAYASLARHSEALPLYESLYQKAPTNFEIARGYFYLLVELEQHEKAARVADALAAATPMYLAEDTPLLRRENPDYAQARRMAGLARGYADDLAAADAMLSRLVEEAPANPDIRAARAALWSWRGWNRKAEEEFAWTLAAHPDHVDSTAGMAEVALARGDWRRAHALIDQLLQDSHGDSPQANRLRRRIEVMMKPQVTGEFAATRSKGAGDVSSEWQLGSYAYSPVWNHRLRVFAHAAEGESAGTDFRLRHRDTAVGMEAWGPDYQARLEARYSGALQRQGLRAYAEWSTSDHVRWRFGAYSLAPGLPAKAASFGIGAQGAETQAILRPHEAASVTAGYRRLGFEDANRRIEQWIHWDQTWATYPAFRFSTALSIWQSRNAREDTAYFSPRRYTTVSIDASYEWLAHRQALLNHQTWHKAAVGAGNTGQAGFGRVGTWSVRYELRSQISDVLDFRLGLSVATAAYDGERSRTKTALLGFSRRF